MASIRLFLLFLSLLFSIQGLAQSTQKKANLDPVDIDFLFHYYDQDGNHSAVTGGLGTEKLTDIASTIIVNVPLDSVSRLGIHTSVNHYSSASTDNIDSYVSSASFKDNHVTGAISYEKTLSGGHRSWSLSAGGGLESDYISTSFGATWWQENPSGSRAFTFSAKAYLDTWIVIFPEELRAPGLVSLPTDKRRSFHFTFTWAQAVNLRLQTALTTELVFQHGLLSTPFHRVFFEEAILLPDIERLPMQRWKVPIGFRASYFASDLLIIRSRYRFYLDSFGIFGQTLSLDLPFKVSPFFSIYPFYRFHFQTAARYFAAHGLHTYGSEYHTSDHDLSGFISHKWGMGFGYAPLNGLLRFAIFPRSKKAIVRSLDARGGYYLRSDGLHAWTVSLGIGLEI